MTRARCAWLAAALAAAACNKPVDTLNEAVSVAQPGGGTAQIFARGIRLPAAATESFTCTKAGETRLLVHVLRGAGKKAEALRDGGWWQVDNVSGGQPGAVKVMVTFDLDAQGHLTLSAREDDRKLVARPLDKPGKLTPSPLSEPDDDEDLEEDSAD